MKSYPRPLFQWPKTQFTRGPMANPHRRSYVFFFKNNLKVHVDKASERGHCGHDTESGGGNRRSGRLKRNNNRRKEVGEEKLERISGKGQEQQRMQEKAVMQPTLDADWYYYSKRYKEVEERMKLIIS